MEKGRDLGLQSQRLFFAFISAVLESETGSFAPGSKDYNTNIRLTSNVNINWFAALTTSAIVPAAFQSSATVEVFVARGDTRCRHIV